MVMEKVEVNEKIVIKCDKNWILETIYPWNNTNPKRWNNYIAVVARKEDGTFNYNWLNGSKETDEWFNITDVVVGDVLMVGVKDGYHPNRPSEKLYYKVMDRTDNELVLVSGNTYRKVKDIKE